MLPCLTSNHRIMTFFFSFKIADPAQVPYDEHGLETKLLQHSGNARDCLVEGH